jgi:hypothetical protein
MTLVSIEDTSGPQSYHLVLATAIQTTILANQRHLD